VAISSMSSMESAVRSGICLFYDFYAEIAICSRPLPVQQDYVPKAFFDSEEGIDDFRIELNSRAF